MSERPWCICTNAKQGMLDRACPVHADMFESVDAAAVAKYEQQMQAAFDAEGQHRDCCCDDSVNPFCKTHPT